jgi:hypothetical protein
VRRAKLKSRICLHHAGALIPLALLISLGCGPARNASRQPDNLRGGVASIVGALELVRECPGNAKGTPESREAAHQSRFAVDPVERCFNAVDDNCNGLIDEGCGTPSGPLQLSLQWEAEETDLDLAVVDPEGQRVSYSAKTAARLQLDRDCPSSDCAGANIETVTSSQPILGTYLIEIRTKMRKPGDPFRAMPLGEEIQRPGEADIRATLGFRFFTTTRAYRIQVRSNETLILRLAVGQ